MSETPALPGPPCDGCDAEPAAMSLLSYSDYSQVKVGVNCAPSFLRSIADSIDGGTTAAAETEPEPPAADPYESSAGSEPDTQPPADEPDDEPGSARDHWASTTHVRRSTHGHRAPRGATGTPGKDDPQ